MFTTHLAITCQQYTLLLHHTACQYMSTVHVTVHHAACQYMSTVHVTVTSHSLPVPVNSAHDPFTIKSANTSQHFMLPIKCYFYFLQTILESSIFGFVFDTTRCFGFPQQPSSGTALVRKRAKGKRLVLTNTDVQL